MHLYFKEEYKSYKCFCISKKIRKVKDAFGFQRSLESYKCIWISKKFV